MPLAPSFYDIATPDDRLIMINTFSKNWAMTGWRMGWMNVPLALGQVIENLIQYNTSGVAVFMQRAGVVALNEGEAFVAEQIARAAEGRRIVTAALSGAPRVRYTPPAGAFYAFFRVDGFDDTTELAFRLIDEAGVGLAPGTAFGAGGDGCLRLCFARSAVSLTTAMDRVASWLRAL
jgi:aspartate/methionine/tyrosine aminotransferase